MTSALVGVAFAAGPMVGGAAGAGLAWARRSGPPPSPGAAAAALSGGLIAVQSVLLVPLAWWMDRAGWPLPALFPGLRHGPGGVALVTALVLALIIGGFNVVAWVSARRAAPTRRADGSKRRHGAAPAGAPARAGGRGPALALGYAAITALYEELVFRGAIQLPLTERFGPVLAVGASALLFGLWHAVHGASSAAFATAAGVVFGVVVARGGDLTPVVAAHVAYNIIAVTRTRLVAARTALPAAPGRHSQELGPGVAGASGFARRAGLPRREDQ